MVSKQLAALSKKGGGTPTLGIDANLTPFLSPAPSKDKKRKKDKSSKKGKKAVPSASTPLLPTLQPKKSKYSVNLFVLLNYTITLIIMYSTEYM